jgi:hypothetical protein
VIRWSISLILKIVILKVYRLVMTFSPPDPIIGIHSTLDRAVISLTPYHFPKAKETASRRLFFTLNAVLSLSSRISIVEGKRCDGKLEAWLTAVRHY